MNGGFMDAEDVGDFGGRLSLLDQIDGTATAAF
jgi:hypothetical protein